MKKKILFTILSFVLLFSANLSNAQTNPKWGSDITISNIPTENQRNVKLAVAFNGWLFSSYESNGRVIISKSINKGETWTIIYTSNQTMTLSDIIVCGNTVSDLKLFLTGYFYIDVNTRYVFVVQYDVESSNYGDCLLYNITGTDVKDVKIASDYKYPGVGSDPYSVAVCFSIRAIPNDSIIFMLSKDGGNTFPITNKKVVDYSAAFFDKISLSYGRSPNSGFGRYFVAYEQKLAQNSEYGDIKFTNSTDYIGGDFNTPLDLSAKFPTNDDVCRNPVISCQADNVSNSVNGLSIMIAYERNIDNLDADICYFYNLNGISLTDWHEGVITNESTNETQVDVTYNADDNAFFATYFNQETKTIPFLVMDLSFEDPWNWAVYETKINNSDNLTDPFPQVEINTSIDQVAFVWTQDGTPATNGVSTFDAEYSTLNSVENPLISNEYKIFPNPANDFINIEFINPQKDRFNIEIIDITGRILINNTYSAVKSEKNTRKIDVSRLPNGIYLCVIKSENKNYSQTQFVISH